METREHAAPPPGWRELLAADPSASPAQRPEVAQTIAAVLPGHRAVWITVEARGETIGGVVGCVRTVASLETLHVMPFLLPGSPVAAPGRHADVDRTVAEHLMRRAAGAGFLGGEWVCYRPLGRVADEALELPPGETRELATSIVDLTCGAAALHDRLDRNTRYAIRRARASGIRFVEEPHALEAVYALHLTQSRSWRGHRALPLELLRRLLAASAGGAEPAARLFVARSRRRLLGGIAILDDAHESLAWWSGAHPSGRGAAMQTGLFWSVIEWAAGRGRRRLNLGGSGGVPGLAAFKQSVGAAEYVYPVRWLAPSRASARVRILGAVQRYLRRGRHRGGTA